MSRYDWVGGRYVAGIKLVVRAAKPARLYSKYGVIKSDLRHFIFFDSKIFNAVQDGRGCIPHSWNATSSASTVIGRKYLETR
jgi:hypothetical protein